MFVERSGDKPRESMIAEAYPIESSSVGSLRRRASGDSEFRIRDSGFPDHSPSGIRNRESGIPIGLRPRNTDEITSRLHTLGKMR